MARVVLTPCVRCGHLTAPSNAHLRWAIVRANARRMASRGLCTICHYRLLKHQPDALLDYPPRCVRRDELLDEWTTLRLDGHTIPQAAPRLGMTVHALAKALARAAADGDPRARFTYAGVKSVTHHKETA